MNLSKEQIEDLIELLYYVGLDSWGKSRQLLEERADKLQAELKLILEQTK